MPRDTIPFSINSFYIAAFLVELLVGIVGIYTGSFLLICCGFGMALYLIASYWYFKRG